MSDNKYRFYDVTVTKTVKALNQEQAVRTVTSNRSINGSKVLGAWVNAERVSAADVHAVLAEQTSN